MEKEINIVFLDNREDLTKNQMQYFMNSLLQMKERGTEKEKNIMKDKAIVDLKNGQFSMQIDTGVKINFRGETLLVDLTTEGELDVNSLRKVERLRKDNISHLTLFAVDLCLDSKDGDPVTGELFGRAIKEKCKNNFDVLYMSGNINFWHSQDISEERWFAYRSVREDNIDERFEATAASPYTYMLLENFGKDDPMFALLKYLLCSRYYCRQYLGVVLLKAYIMLKAK